MANRKNPTTEKAKSKAVKPQNLKASRSAQVIISSQNVVLVVSLAVVLICCLMWRPFRLDFIVSTLFSSASLSLLITPTLPFLLVPVFCCLALYLLLTKRSIGKFATISTFIFTAVALCFIISGVSGLGQRCGGLSCTAASELYFYALFLYNPVANLLWNTLAITSIILLTRRLRSGKITKQGSIEKEEAAKALMLNYILMGIAVLAVVLYLIFWYSNEAFKTVHWGFTY